MRVYELAKELGIESAMLLEVLEGLGLAVGSKAAGLSEDEAEHVRAVLAKPAQRKPQRAGGARRGGEGGTPVTPALTASGKTGQPKGKPKGKPTGKPKGYVLTGKGSVQLAGPGHPIIRRGERITPAQWSTLPERLQGYFEAAA